MSINLGLRFSHPQAASHYVRFRRIDNAVNNPYTSVSPNPITSPAILATDIPNGEYEIESTPVYADGRPCAPTVDYTPGCATLISINAYITGNNLVIQYLAPPDAPKVRLTASYPNGGGSVANYVNNGSNVVIPIPANIYGDIQVSGQSVCDEGSGFYSGQSATVTVTRLLNNLSFFNNANGITLTGVNGVTGYVLSQFIAYGETQEGNHQAFFGGFSIGFSGTPGANSSATLSLNGTQIQCVNVPNTNGGTISFSSVSYASTDQINVAFVPGSCGNQLVISANTIGADESAACAGSPTVMYSSAPVGTGTIVYFNSTLTNPVTGFLILKDSTGTLYNINTSTGEIGSPTGNSC